MKKYLYIFKSEILSNLQYASNLLVGILGYLLIIVIFFSLWNYMYDDPSQLINEYSKSQMIWYVMITELLWSCFGGRTFCRIIINDVRSGNIAYNMNKPYSYIGYVLASNLGKSTVKAILYVPIVAIVGLLFIGNLNNIGVIELIIVGISAVLAIIINSLIVILIGLLAFKIEDSNPVYWLYSKMLLIIGTIFPIEFFPKSIQPVIMVSPIFATCYGPAKLFVDFSWQMAGYVLIAQIVYIVVMYGLCEYAYKKGVKKLNVNGG